MENENLETQIKALEKKRFQCLIEKNFDELGKLFDDNLCYIHTSGTVEDRETLLNKLKSGYYDYQSIDYDIVEITDRQDCVIVRAHFYADILVDKVPRKLQNRALSIWLKQDDQLKLYLYQATAFSN